MELRDTRGRFTKSCGGKNHPRWKGGRCMSSSDGYVRIHQPNHPYAQKTGYVFEHRLVMEKKLGRYLEPHEIVHHLNGISDDNREENLELLSSRGEHIKKMYELCEENKGLKKIILMLLLLRGRN